MRIRTVILLTTACLLSAVAGESPGVIESFGRKRSYPTSATLKQCPDGHTTLKDVPIVYGLPPFDGPAAERLRERIQKFETWSGGCVGPPDAPTVRPTCTTCGFGYDSTYAHWSRQSTDLATFKRAFSPLVASFPKPTAEHQKGDLRYYQSVSTNRVVYQSVSFTSTEPRDALIARINAWFSTNSIRMTYAEREYTVTFDGPKLISDWEGRDVSAMLHHKKKNGDSWVMLNVVTR